MAIMRTCPDDSDGSHHDNHDDTSWGAVVVTVAVTVIVKVMTGMLVMAVV